MTDDAPQGVLSREDMKANMEPVSKVGSPGPGAEKAEKKASKKKKAEAEESE